MNPAASSLESTPRLQASHISFAWSLLEISNDNFTVGLAFAFETFLICGSPPVEEDRHEVVPAEV